MKYDDNMILLLPVKGSPQLVPLHHLLPSLWQPAGVDQALLSFIRTACRPLLGNPSLMFSFGHCPNEGGGPCPN